LKALEVGGLCKSCRLTINESKNYNADIGTSTAKLQKVLSDKYPFSLILKGGGVKGIAFAGALEELNDHFFFNAFAGTSAGALAAVLLGAGYTSSELLENLSKKDFKDFKDARWAKKYINFTFRKWFYPGNSITVWLDDLLKRKIRKQQDIALSDLPKRTVLYASKAGRATFIFDSKGRNADYKASFAARCSMSIPYYFEPETVEGKRIFDGGIRNNFPIQRFLEDNRGNPFIGLYLIPSKTPKNLPIKKRLFRWLMKDTIASELLDIVVDGDEAELVDKYPNSIVKIDVHTIQTTDFDLTDKEKEFLELAGRVAALNFLKENYPDIDLDEDRIERLEKKVSQLKSEI
jgi:predicted acylesterase/phospholipase RssA